MTQRVKIALGVKGDGTLECVGFRTFPCQGLPGTAYLKDITVHAKDKERVHHSQEFNCDMPFAILILPARGIFIHEWAYCSSEDGPSQGCIHVCPPNAEAVFNWIEDPTRITIEYPW
jgi:hypothetical protein